MSVDPQLGGLPFGYRTELAPGADASAKHPPKRLVVDQDQAAERTRRPRTADMQPNP